MTASTTHCWKRQIERRLIGYIGCVCLWLCLGVATAGEIVPQRASLGFDDRAYTLEAEFAIRLGSRLEDAVALGVPLDFRLEFVLTRKRRYWVDEHITSRVIHYRLSYHALTRQYRLSIGGLHQSFASLDEALRVLQRVARLSVAATGDLVPGERYGAAVRLSLDHARLPRPLQVDALADPEWRVETQTLRWEFVHDPKP